MPHEQPAASFSCGDRVRLRRGGADKVKAVKYPVGVKNRRGCSCCPVHQMAAAASDKLIDCLIVFVK